MRTRIWWGIGLLLAAGLIGQVALYWSQKPDTHLHASWKFRPQSLHEARQLSKGIVLASVIAVQPGQDLVTSVPGEPTGADRIPTQIVTLKVIKAYKGAYKAGQQVKLFQTGGILVAASGHNDEALQTAGRRFILEGDPLYQVGEQYMLMLSDGPRGMQRTIAPEGRYRVEGGRLTPMVDSQVAREVGNKSLQTLEAEIAEVRQ